MFDQIRGTRIKTGRKEVTRIMNTEAQQFQQAKSIHRLCDAMVPQKSAFPVYAASWRQSRTVVHLSRHYFGHEEEVT